MLRSLTALQYLILLITIFPDVVLCGQDDMSEGDWKTLENNLVVLKGKIDEGFIPQGEPLKIQGQYHTATLTKYTNDGKCFQLFSLETDMIEIGKSQDNVKISCAMSVPDGDMKSTGIRIGAIVTELSPGRFMYIIRGGNCHRRLYLTFIKPRTIEIPIGDFICTEYTNTRKEDRERGVFTPIGSKPPESVSDDQKDNANKAPKSDMNEESVGSSSAVIDTPTTDSKPDMNNESKGTSSAVIDTPTTDSKPVTEDNSKGTLINKPEQSNQPNSVVSDRMSQDEELS